MSACLIDPARLSELLGAGRGRFDVDAIAECESSNETLLQRAANGAPAGAVVVADRQRAGRGRRGRAWMSSPEASLTFSLLWRFAGDPTRLSGLSLAVGVAVARALEACGVEGVALKWPNDVLLGGQSGGKLCGILIEISGERGAIAVVIGIGLNLLPPTIADDRAGALPAASLADAGTPLPERHRLLAALLDALATTLDTFAAGGFAALRHEWQLRHGWQGLPVRLHVDAGAGDALASGRCLGADEDGALLIETADGRIERFLVGDVSLRAA
jgi:BirA family biotin operon repressor/biotin-[acetyl-CoA-carboxylase] ligase